MTMPVQYICINIDEGSKCIGERGTAVHAKRSAGMLPARMYKSKRNLGRRD